MKHSPRIRNAFFTISLLVFSFSKAQTYSESYASVVAQCSESGILTNLTEFENLGVKYRSTTAQANALQWLKNKYLSYGYTVSQMAEDSYTYSGSTCKNLIVTKTGTLYPNIFVIIDGHYDTLNGPGTNDNGTGTACVLEIARLLQNIPTEYSVKFINFSGEEDGLKGSQHYVNSVVNATTPKMNIRLVLNVDEIGGVAGQVNNTVNCERDTSNPTTNNATSTAFNQQLMNCVTLYTTLNTFLSHAYDSDYMPFQSNNEVIIGLYENNESPYPHSVNDVLANMDPNYAYKVIQAATAAMLHFTNACETCILETGSITPQDFEIKLYPNPAKGLVNIDKGMLVESNYSVTILDANGKVILKKEFQQPQQNEQMALQTLSDGIYHAIITSGDKRIVKKFIIKN